MVMLSLPNNTPFVRAASLYSFLLVFGLVYRHLIVLAKADGAETANTAGQSSRVGLRGYAQSLPTMIVAGQLLGLVGYGLLRSHYNFHDTLTPIVAAAAVIFALAEEIVFRGLIQQQAMYIMKPLYAGAMSTAIFGALTVGQGLPWAPLFGIVLGASLSYIYAHKPNILLTWVVNIACKLTFLGLLSAIS
jgi:membrane protease YdiL (CAAX protease family)